MPKKKKPESQKPVEYYVCVKECFYNERLWTPIGKALKEKDYLLTVDKGAEVPETLFTKVDAPPEFGVPEEPKPSTFSEIQRGRPAVDILA